MWYLLGNFTELGILFGKAKVQTLLHTYSLSMIIGSFLFGFIWLRFVRRKVQSILRGAVGLFFFAVMLLMLSIESYITADVFLVLILVLSRPIKNIVSQISSNEVLTERERIFYYFGCTILGVFLILVPFVICSIFYDLKINSI